MTYTSARGRSKSCQSLMADVHRIVSSCFQSKGPRLEWLIIVYRTISKRLISICCEILMRCNLQNSPLSHCYTNYTNIWHTCESSVNAVTNCNCYAKKDQLYFSFFSWIRLIDQLISKLKVFPSLPYTMYDKFVFPRIHVSLTPDSSQHSNLIWRMLASYLIILLNETAFISLF